MSMKKLNLFLLFLCTLGVGFLVNNQKSLAVSASDWKPGRIIDDVVFQNKQSMTVQQIQQFLDSKVPSCDRNGSLPMWSGGPTRAQWSLDNGKDPAPYTCLKEYVENPTTKVNNATDPTIVVPGGLSAAQLIYNASQAQNVNPQVYLVLLQKEQSLVTDDWPYAKQFERATGNNCPDTAPCDPAYAWLSTQVNNAGAQFNYYVTHFSQYNYAPGWNNILYNPNAGCGRQSVFIENAYTAALYIYTPYVPNQAALDNMYGTGDGCSAYGNRNFWRLFNDWFGSSLAPNFDWMLESQSLYTDNTKATGSSTQLVKGSRAYAVIRIRNNGNQTWLNNGPNPIRFGTSRPLERQSSICDPTWLSCSRVAGMNETSVAPGAIGTFEFWIDAKQVGLFNEYLTPVIEGLTWLRDIGLFYTIDVKPATYTWQMTSQYAYTDETKTTIKNLSNLLPGERAFIGFTARNTGNQTWLNSGPHALLVGTVSPQERSSAFSPGSGWLSGTRPALLREASVAPGAIGTFEFWLTAPPQTGVRHERFGLIANGLTWLNDTGLSFYTDVKPPTYTWQMVSQYAYTDETKTTVKSLNSLVAGEKVYIGFTARNTGNQTWLNGGDNAVSVGTLSPYERSSVFSPGSNWLSGTRPAVAKEATVAPGTIGTFEFWLTAPPQTGVRHERFGLIANGIKWMNDTGLSFYTNIQ